MKQLLLITLISLVGVSRVSAMGKSAPAGVSLLLVPSVPSMIQVGLDMAELDQALLMSYSPTAPADAPYLHIWDGQRWLPVSAERFAAGTFLGNNAARMVVVGSETDQTAALIEQAVTWCPELLHMETSNVTELLNQLGKVYKFNRSDWQWLAQRYELQLDDLTADLPHESWYDSNKPEDVPESERPWKREKNMEEAPPPPTTSLTPVEDAEPLDTDVYHLEVE